MAAMSRGNDKKPPRPTKPRKGGTASSRKHHFESFTQRVAKLNIDPVRRARRAGFDDQDLSATASYLKTSLEEWKDLNLSDNFHQLSRELEPLCGSLPQILHYDDRIMDLLIAYIEKGDALSLEPLLSLVSHFAHDMGARFEKHFARTVQTVCQLAAKHPDIEVIEWSFTCLAWLFKYLSRLLVPDLRPLYDLMAPMLGKEHQKHFVTRFAAEALSFLLRKAGATYHRDKEPLRIIVSHAIKDVKELAERADTYQYQQGLMSLFIESIKGVHRGLHSSGPAVFRELVAQTLSSGSPGESESLVPDDRPAMDVVRGVLTATIHHTDSETFKPILEVVLEQLDGSASSMNKENLEAAACLLFTVAGVRQGSRIDDWGSLMRNMAQVIYSAESSQALAGSGVASEILAALAVILQTCPMDIAIPHLRILDTVCSGPWQDAFLLFCNFFAELGTERFQSLLLPHFKRFIVSRWNRDAERLALLIPRFAGRGCFFASPLICPSAWQENIIASFKHLSGSPGLSEIAKCNATLGLVRVASVEPKTEAEIYAELYKLLSGSLEADLNDSSPQRLFGAGSGFRYVAERQNEKREDGSLWISLCRSATKYIQYPVFTDAVFRYLKSHAKGLNMDGEHAEILVNAVIDCLGSPSHELRMSSLDILQLIYSLKHNGEESEILSVAILIESMPLNIQTGRTISMHIRRLAAAYKTAVADPWLARAVPTFCFGLLYVNFTQVWEDSCNVLKEICETKEGETAVSELAFKWLDDIPHSEVSSSMSSPAPSSDEPTQGTAANEFECTNISYLSNLSKKSSELLNDAAQQLKAKFESEHEKIEFITASSRSQALRVLNAIPQVAEKKSRSLVPILLKWAIGSDGADEILPEDLPDSTDVAVRWVRKDQKAMLSLFAQFSNPKVLYKSAEVYSALLVLLGNGDVEIQKLALKAVFTWKNRSINRYEENLLNLLDDARFREQISVFLDIDQDEESMQAEDRTDLMPVILHMLYGKIIARAGSASGRRGQESRRKAVFIALTKFGNAEIRQFLGIALGPLSSLSLITSGQLQQEKMSKELLNPRKQFGLLNMLEDMLDTLGTQLAPFTGQLIDPVLYCLVNASRAIVEISQAEQSETSGSSLLNSIRQVGFHCLNGLFNYCPEFEQWDDYIPTILHELVNPRLEKLPVETAQSVSGILRLFSTWSKSPQTVAFLVKYSEGILDRVADCLEVTFAKEDVKLFILRDILQNLVVIAETDVMDVDESADQSPAFVQERILKPKAGHILSCIGGELQRSPGKELLDVGVQTISRLAPFVAGSANSESMIRISNFLLQQPTKRVSPRTKSDLLNILHNFVPRCGLGRDDDLTQQVFQTTCSLFSYFQDRRSRNLLCDILEDLAQIDPDLAEVASFSHALNAFSQTRLDEPDFDRRSKAFHAINEDRYSSLTIKQWLPLVYNMLFYIKEQEELVLRINASFALRRFVEVAARDNADQESFQKLITTAIIPGIHNGVREKSELVRTEYLSVLAQIVRQFPSWPVVSDMHVLLVDDDEEASFFSNVLHIQQHRRLRAVRRLASEASKLSSGNVSHIFVPLIEHFIFDRAEDDSGANNLAGEATATIGALSLWLEWPQYRALLRRYSQGEMEKITIRLLGVVIDSFNKAAQTKGLVSPPRTEEAVDLADEEMADADSMGSIHVDKVSLTGLARTLPNREKLSSDLTNNLLPPLVAYIHHKDESTVSLRVPVAVIVVKLLRLLPTDGFTERLPPVLMDVCAILRSRDQQARDMTRKTLADISALIGPQYFGFLLKALRTALQRGYQLHVLSFTVHSILVSMTPTFKPGELDYCLSEIVAVIMDDIFGVTGQEKDAEEYVSKMKEVKGSKSFDSMELIAKTTTIKHFMELVSPIKSLLLEKLDLKMAKKIDELLRRIGLGIMHNGAIHDREVLVFCYQLIQDVYKSNADRARNREDEDPRTKRYLINMKTANKNTNRGAITSQIHKLIRFSLDVLRSVLHKHDELQTPANTAGFMPIIGDAIVSGQEEIQMSAIRLLSSIIKVPLPQIDRDATVYVSEAIRIIRGERDSNTELAQASLKLISAVLRERRSATVKEKDVAYLLKRIKDDLEEPDRQGVTFNFLKAVLGRKIVITEVYEILDTVATVMVTNQTRTARDLSRGVYFQFIMEYPQSKERLSKQIAFLVKNLDYKYKEGRQSVMEAMHLLLNKTGDEIVQEIANDVFAPLVLRIVNDDDKECREMAGVLLKKVFERADTERTKKFTGTMRAWLEQDEVTLKRRLAIQCFTLYLEVKEGQTKEVNYLLRQLPNIMQGAHERQEEGDWELLYYSLQAFAKLCKLSPAITFAAGSQPLWTTTRACLTFPHAWVKLSAARLIGLYFADFASHNAADGYAALPLTGSGGLKLTGEDMLDLTPASLRILRVPGVNEELATQAVRNLVFLGRCFAVNELRWKATNAVDESALNEAAEEGPSSSENDDVEGADVEEAADGTAAVDSGKTALQYLFERLSAILRREPATTRAPALYPKAASMTLVAALCNTLPLPSLAPCLPTILLPLHNLTDPTISAATSLDEAFNEAYKGLQGTATEVMTLLQKKMGTSEYVAVLQKVREGVKERREERRVKRRLEAVKEPERAEKTKRRKHEKERVRRKEKGKEARGRRRGW